MKKINLEIILAITTLIRWYSKPEGGNNLVAILFDRKKIFISLGQCRL